MRRGHRPKAIALLVGLLLFLAPAIQGDWKQHSIRHRNGKRGDARLPGKFQIVTESWSRTVAVPYIVHMPEKRRLLMLVACCDYPHQAMTLASDDLGATWSQPQPVHVDAAGKPGTGMGLSLTYLGNGAALLASGEASIWFSSDYGATWSRQGDMPKAYGLVFNPGDPFFVRMPDRILAGGYSVDKAGHSTASIKMSGDRARAWSDFNPEPEWPGVNEVAFARASDGDLVAACRTDAPERFRKTNFDHYEGLAVSISKDDGKTWSKLNRLYAWRRHHPSLTLLPNGDLVMAYVVRKGYPDTAEGYPQFGIAAIVSSDNGATWDLDHRYILATWKGITKGPNAWSASSQSTSTVLLPDGGLLTAFGTGYRSQDPSGRGRPGPRDVGLVSWNTGRHAVNTERTISRAAYDSDPRNGFDPSPSNKKIRPACAAASGKENVAVNEVGARVAASASDGAPADLLRNRYYRPVLTLQSMPA